MWLLKVPRQASTKAAQPFIFVILIIENTLDFLVCIWTFIFHHSSKFMTKQCKCLKNTLTHNAKSFHKLGFLIRKYFPPKKKHFLKLSSKVPSKVEHHKYQVHKYFQNLFQLANLQAQELPKQRD